MKFLMCNLKSNKNLKEILAYKKDLMNLDFKDMEFVLFPSSLYLSFFFDAKYHIGSQNISANFTGSFTGEILASQLKSLNVKYVLINHSETNEKNKDIIMKIKNATKAHIKVVLCIGEVIKRGKEKTIEELKTEINQIFSKLTKEEQENIILAYEPCWAVNQNVIINPEIIANIIKKIKKELLNTYDLNLPILYGGSINTKNIQELNQYNDIDGYLIGNCANNSENIFKILEMIK